MKKIFVLMFVLGLLSACTPVRPTLPSATMIAPSPEPIHATSTSTILLTSTETVEPTPTLLLRIVPEETTLTYEVGETFINQNNRFATAIGMTSEVNGEVYANLEDPSKSSLGVITVDISTLTSDNSRRDNAIRRDWLESSKYPLVTFVPRSITNLPETFTPGQPYTFEVQGELTIKQTTLGAEFSVTASFDQQELKGSAVSEFKMSDFDIGPINLAGILKTEDLVKIHLDFVARP